MCLNGRVIDVSEEGPASSTPPIGLRWAQERVRAFHLLADQPAPVHPTSLTRTRLETRMKWMQEELDELAAAGSVVDQVDALTDLMYFALGTFVEMGIDAEKPFDIVHRANITKLTSPKGRVNAEDGKVEKPDGWVSPEPVIAAHIVETCSHFTLVEASSDSGCANACLAMVLRTLGVASDVIDLSGSSMLTVPPQSLSPAFAERGIPIVDDYVVPDAWDVPTFTRELTIGLGLYPALMIGFDPAIAYRHGDSSLRFALVAGVDGETVRLIDPSPHSRGLACVPADDLLEAIQKARQGIHRFAAR